MATYPVKHKETGEMKDVVMSVHAWDQWKEDNPEWERYYTPYNAPGVGEVGDSSESIMKWSLAYMIEIEEKDRENFPNPNGGFYEKRIDTENAKVFDNFLDAMVKLNEKAKQGLGDGGQETTL